MPPSGLVVLYFLFVVYNMNEALFAVVVFMLRGIFAPIFLTHNLRHYRMDGSVSWLSLR
jgi:hypothetical protein